MTKKMLVYTFIIVTMALSAGLLGTNTMGHGTLIKLKCPADAGANHVCKGIYYVDFNGKRYVFPNEKTYKTWYNDFSGVQEVEEEEMLSYPLSGNVTYRPGIKLIKIQTNPKVYTVDCYEEIRWVKSPEIAEELYGVNWNLMVEDVSDVFFTNYNIGAEIEKSSDYDIKNVKISCSTIDNIKARETTQLLKICPNEWIDNQMPCSCIDLPLCESCNEPPREYFILNGERRELSEFDLNWVFQNCDIEVTIAY